MTQWYSVSFSSSSSMSSFSMSDSITTSSYPVIAPKYLSICARIPAPSTSSSNTKVNLTSYGNSFSCIFLFKDKSGEGNKGSKMIRKQLSKSSGIMRHSKLHAISKHGFVFTSIRYSLKSSSSMKS